MFSPLLLAVVVSSVAPAALAVPVHRPLLTSDPHCTVACQLDPRQTQRLLISQTRRLMFASRYIRYISHTIRLIQREFYSFWCRRRHLCWKVAPGIFAHRRYQSDLQVCSQSFSFVTRFQWICSWFAQRFAYLAAEPGSGQVSAASLPLTLDANMRLHPSFVRPYRPVQFLWGLVLYQCSTGSAFLELSWPLFFPNSGDDDYLGCKTGEQDAVAKLNSSRLHTSAYMMMLPYGCKHSLIRGA